MINPITLVKTWWKNHGTKILGFFTAAFSSVSVAIHTYPQELGTFIHTKWLTLATVFTGIVTIYRGFTNTKNLNNNPPPPPPAA